MYYMSVVDGKGKEALSSDMSNGEFYVPVVADCEGEIEVRHAHEQLGTVAFRGAMGDWHPTARDMFTDVVLDAQLSRASGVALSADDQNLLRADLLGFYDRFAWWVSMREQGYIAEHFDTDRLIMPPLEAFYVELSRQGTESHRILTLFHGNFNLTPNEHANLARVLACMCKTAGSAELQDLNMIVILPTRDMDSLKLVYAETHLVMSAAYLGIGLDEVIDHYAPEMTPRYVFERLGREVIGNEEDKSFANLQISSFTEYLHAVPVITSAVILDTEEQ